MVKKQKAKSFAVQPSSIESARMKQDNQPASSEIRKEEEQVANDEPNEDTKDVEEAPKIFAQPVESSEFVDPPGDSNPNETTSYHVPATSLFDEPEGFGIVQNWDNNPVINGLDIKSSNFIEETIQDPVLTSSPIKQPARQRKGSEKEEVTTTQKKKEARKKEKGDWWNQKEMPDKAPPVKILQRTKTTWENVKIPPFLYDPELKHQFINFYEDRLAVEREGDFGKLIFGCSDLIDAVFCTMKDANPMGTNQFSVFSVFEYGSSEDKIRSMIKELQADYLYKVQTGEDRVSKMSLPYLAKWEVKALENKVANFPGAHYYCELCDYHINNVGHFREHMRSGPHMPAVEIRDQRIKFVREMPIMLENQRKAIKRTIDDVCSRATLPLKNIANVVQDLLLQRLKSIKGLEERVPDLQLMGSVFYDAFNPASDINFSLSYENVDPSDVLSLICTIQEDFNGTRPFEDFGKIEFSNGAHPRVSMIYHDTTPVLVLWMATEKLALSRLIKRYTDLHPDIPRLMMLIRHWAKLCNLCASYGLVNHGFDLMVIHCLQQRGVISVITNEVASPCSPRAVDLALEFVAFFAYYSKKMDTVVQIQQKEPMLKRNTKWSNKIFQIKDPIRDENVVFFPRTFQPYFLNCFLATYIYFAIPRKNSQPIIDIALTITDPNKKRNNERQHKPDNAFTPATTPAKANESHEPQTPVKKSLSITKEQAMTDPRLEVHERRWQHEGKHVEEEPVAFLRNRVDEALATPSGKRKTYNRNRTRPKNKGVVQPETTSKVNADFPTTQVNGVNLAQLQAIDVEINDERVYSREKFSEAFSSMVVLEEDGYALKDEFLQKLVKNKILRAPTFRDPNTAQKHYSEVYFSKMKDEKPVLQNVEIKSDEAVQMGHSLDDKLASLSLKDDVQLEVDSSTVMDALEAALPDVTHDVTYDDEKVDVTISEEEHPAMSELSEGSVVGKEEAVLPDQQETNKGIARDDFRIRCLEWPLDAIFQKAASWTPEEYSYDLNNAANFTGGWLPDVRCSHCESNKHQNADCPEMKIPEIVPITYKRPVEEDHHLTQMMHEVCQQKRMKQETIDSISETVKQLENVLRPVFPDVRLDLFGSLYNGFGTTSSDADICFRFSSDTAPENVNVEETLHDVSRTLKKTYGHKMYVMNITQAKVPIIKFSLKAGKGCNLEGDISYYNTLALANTRMLFEYTKWDRRVAELGLWVKTWANRLHINDASKGSLSSYSYIIMVIHYLQQLTPPVLPRLQEEFRKDAPPELQGDHDVYYHETGPEKEPWSKNKETLSELFVGFLNYYSKFDYNNQIIQIRRLKPLSKLEKGWTKPICLEDPFDLKHNLGSVVNQRMFFFIMKTFRSSRETFMNMICFNGHNMSYLDIANGLFHVCYVGHPPISSKQCFSCYRIGHTKENCPRRIEAEKLNAGMRGGPDGNRRRDERNQRGGAAGGRPWQNRDNGFRGNGPRRDV